MACRKPTVEIMLRRVASAACTRRASVVSPVDLRMTTLYETIRIKDGRLPLLERHLARLEEGCRALGMDVPGEFVAKLEALGLDEGGDRVVRVEWNGAEVNIVDRPLPSVAPISLTTSSVIHPGYAIKTTARAAFEEAHAEARNRGADEGLLLTASGHVAEGSLFAIGWFEGEVMRVPSLDLGILPSIGRGRVIEVAGAAGIEVEQGHFGRGSLDGRPVFITTAVRGVVDVAMLDGVKVPDDQRVAHLRDRFWPD